MSTIKDLNLAPSGERKIRWVEAHMPVLRDIGSDFAREKPFAGLKIALSVHLEAKKLGLRGIPRSELPRFKYLIRNVYLLLPLVFLIWMVTANIRSLQFSAAIAILISIAVSLVGTCLLYTSDAADEL